ncbi:MAG: tetratricopeptide repeat protein [Proteobacteria bacterium]|nr:tetratricopeptide repeat protein [Pseudomonadota bacterium]
MLAPTDKLTFIITFLTLLTLSACGDPAPVEQDPHRAGYVGSERCGDCHVKEHDDWQKSHHRLAMLPASAESVLGDFNNSTFDNGVMSALFTHDGTGYWIETEGERHKVSETFGADPLQQYLIDMGDGRKQAFSVAWDTREQAAGGQRWFHLYGDDTPPPGDVLHWRERSQNWNMMCADCHSTAVKKGFDGTTYNTTFKEINVGCEACHGPGAQHIEAVEDGLGGRYSEWLGEPRAVETCAVCHSRRTQLDDEYVAGDRFFNHYRPNMLDGSLYTADGQILDEVYVYGSFMSSRMAEAGVTCNDCHDAHTGSPRALGNALCTQCHSQTPRQSFATLKAKAYDTPEHHFHTAGVAGSQCVDCHMPARTYMVVDDRRDHSFRVPRPDLSARYEDVPNACNGCHIDQSAQWAADQITTRFGYERRPHFAELLTRANRGDRDIGPQLVRAIEDQSIPAIVRGTLATHLDRQQSWTAREGVYQALSDEDPLVKMGALSSIGRLDTRRQREWLITLTGDDRKAIRTEAGAATASTSQSGLSEVSKYKFDRALDLYMKVQTFNADWPQSHTNIAAIYNAQGDIGAAEEALNESLRIEPRWVPGMINLAEIYRVTGRDSDAALLLQRALDVAPDSAEATYALALWQVRDGRYEPAIKSFRRAAELRPDALEYAFTLSVALNDTGDPEGAIEALLEAHERFGEDPQILNTLVTYLVKAEQYAQAIPYAVELLSQNPDDRRLNQLLTDLMVRTRAPSN